jgi:hypothetical protein
MMIQQENEIHELFEFEGNLYDDENITCNDDALDQLICPGMAPSLASKAKKYV